jgi:hypothetical protein
MSTGDANMSNLSFPSESDPPVSVEPICKFGPIGSGRDYCDDSDPELEDIRDIEDSGHIAVSVTEYILRENPNQELIDSLTSIQKKQRSTLAQHNVETRMFSLEVMRYLNMIGILTTHMKYLENTRQLYSQFVNPTPQHIIGSGTQSLQKYGERKGDIDLSQAKCMGYMADQEVAIQAEHTLISSNLSDSINDMILFDISVSMCSSALDSMNSVLADF